MERKRKQKNSRNRQSISSPFDMSVPNKASKRIKAKTPQSKRNPKKNNVWEKGKILLETIPKWMYVMSSVIIGLFAILSGIASIISADAAKESVVAANKSIDISEQSLRISNRAYVHATGVKIDSAKQPPLLRVHVVNNGLTPAYKVRTHARFINNDFDQCFTTLSYKDTMKVGSHAILPQKTVIWIDDAITENSINKIRSFIEGRKFLKVYGWVTYNTIFAEQCSTIFSFIYKADIKGFGFCPTNNDDYRKINNEWVKVPR